MFLRLLLHAPPRKRTRYTLSQVAPPPAVLPQALLFTFLSATAMGCSDGTTSRHVASSSAASATAASSGASTRDDLANTEPSPPSPMTIRVAFDANTDRWTVTYELEQPTRELVFLRDRHRFRAERWEIQTPGVHWAPASGDSQQERLLFDGSGTREGDEGNATTVTLSFDTDRTHRRKDYTLHFAYTDGGRLLFTGHLLARPVEATSLPPITWSITGSITGPQQIAMAHLSGEGRLEGNTPHIDARGGTYAYLGPQSPRQLGPLRAIIDPALPSPLQDPTLRHLEALFDWYGHRVGQRLEARPLVLITYDPERRDAEPGREEPGREEPGRAQQAVESAPTGPNRKGGVVAGAVQLHAGGTAWEDATLRDQWFQFLAHEAFHLWNVQRFPAAGDATDEWLAEGSSDLFALEAMVHFGLIDQQTFEERLVRAANRCLLTTQGRALLDGDYPYGAYYACGTVYLHLLDQELRRVGQDLAQLLGRLWAQTESRGWTTGDLLATSQLHVPEASHAIRRALYEGWSSPTEHLARWFGQHGLTLETTLAGEADADPDDCIRALLYRFAACGCRVSANLRQRPLAFHLRACHADDESAQEVRDIAGHDFTNHACAAYGAFDTQTAVPSCNAPPSPLLLRRVAAH